MKFLCGSCRTKYQISDEKVRGKILKIRCKKCGAHIIVRESLVKDTADTTVVAPVAEGPQSSPAAVMPSEGALSQALDQALASGETHDVPVQPEAGLDLDWYVAVKGQQSGPFPYAQLIQQLESGQLLGRDYVWHEGMENWTRIREMPGLQDHLAPPTPPSPPPPPPAAAATGDLQLGATPLDPSELPTTATASTLFGNSQAPGATRVEQAATQVVPTASDAPGSLDDLLALGGDDADPFANVPRATEADLVPKESTRFFVKAALKNTRSRNRVAFMLGGVSLMLILGVVGSAAAGWIKFDLPGIGNPFAATGKQPVLYDFEGEDPEAIRKALAGLSPEERDRVMKARQTQRVRPGSKARSNEIEYIDDREEGGGPKSRLGDGPVPVELGISTGGGALNDSVGTSELPDVEVDIPQVQTEQLSEEAIRRTVQVRKRSVRMCYQRQLKDQNALRGRLDVEVRIQPDGRVSRSQVKTPQFKGSRVGRCIASKIKGWRFPPFEGEPQDILVPFVFEASAF